MAKLPMYIVMGITMGLGGYIPVLFGESAFGGWSIIGTVIGGIVGIFVLKKLRDFGYLD